MIAFLNSKAVLIGLHLAFAIVGIDAYLWYLGELHARSSHWLRARYIALVGFSDRNSKAVLIGLHLAFAIVGIDAYLWYLGELHARSSHWLRARYIALVGF